MIVRVGLKQEIRAIYYPPRRIGYWNWKRQLEMMLGHKFDWMELEFVWYMYDLGLNPWEAWQKYQNRMLGGGTVELWQL
jgi:hypothetical protein